MIIQHGVPKHAFFGIVLPLSYIIPSFDELSQDYAKPIFDFHDPYTDERFRAQVYCVSTLTIRDFCHQAIPSYMAYGVPPQEAIKKLQKSYPEIRKTQQLRYIVLEKL